MTLLISCSNSVDSINKDLLNSFLKLDSSADTLFLDSFQEIPIYSKEAQFEGIPGEIKSIFEKIRDEKYRVIVMFAPEHNGYFSAFLKNIIDWLSRIQLAFLEKKDVVVVSASYTKRNVRVMEPSIKATLSMFAPKSITFINFNKMNESLNVEKRVVELLNIVDEMKQ